MSDKINLDEREFDKLRKKYEALTISDDFMFYKVMQNPDLCKELLEIVLDIDIDKLEYISRQEVIKDTYDGKGVRLDVYTKDAEGTIYNLEMQAVKIDDIPKRSRYYQGVIDTDTLKEGNNYNKLNKSIILFICRFDLFGKGRPIYTFKNYCEEEPGLELGDAATKIFINSKWILDKDKWEESIVKPKLINLLKYIEEGEATDEYTEKLEVEVSKVKQDSVWREKYMVYEKNLYYSKLEGHEEGLKEGIALGIEQGQARTSELYVKLIDDGRFDDARRAKENPEYFNQLLEEYSMD